MFIHEISAEDMLAFGDVLDQLQAEASPPNGEASPMSVERAASLIEALDKIAKMVGDTKAMLKSRAITALEGQPRVVGDTVYSVSNDVKKRPNHPKIRAAIVAAAQFDALTGERIEGPREAAWRAVELTYEVFVAPATKPKAEGLRAIHLSSDDAVEEEVTGKSLKVTQL